MDINTKDKKKDIIKLEIPADKEYMVLVRLCISAVADRMEFSVDETEEIKVAVGEACNNAICHNYKRKQAPGNILLLRFIISPTKLTVTIKDNGKGFDVKEKEKCIQQRDQNHLKGCCLGLFLMKALMDEFECKSSPNGTEVKMVKNKRA